MERNGAAAYAHRPRHHTDGRNERDIGCHRSRLRNAVGPRNAHGHPLRTEIGRGALSLGQSATNGAIRGGDQERPRLDGRKARPTGHDSGEPCQARGGTAGGCAQQRATENFLQLASCKLAGV